MARLLRYFATRRYRHAVQAQLHRGDVDSLARAQQIDRLAAHARVTL